MGHGALLTGDKMSNLFALEQFKKRYRKASLEAKEGYEMVDIDELTPEEQQEILERINEALFSQQYRQFIETVCKEEPDHGY